MKLNEMKIKLGEKIVESPRLLKEEKLEILACIKEEKNSEILDALLHEYEIDKNKLIKKFDKVDSSTESLFISKILSARTQSCSCR